MTTNKFISFSYDELNLLKKIIDSLKESAMMNTEAWEIFESIDLKITKAAGGRDCQYKDFTATKKDN